MYVYVKSLILHVILLFILSLKIRDEEFCSQYSYSYMQASRAQTDR